MYILILDTSTRKMSLALLDIESNEIVALYVEEEQENSHAKKINLTILQLLENVNKNFSDIAAIAVNEGPGSFTGLRVGSSTAKGMCLALDIPLIAISGLVAYGRYLYSIKAEEVTDVFILMDARRDNFFYAHIKNKHSMKESVFANRVDIETVIQCCLRPWVFYTDKSEEIKLTAKELKQGVIEKWKTQDFESLASFEPKYIVNNYISKK